MHGIIMKFIVKLFASSWYISLLIYMMHGHTYIKFELGETLFYGIVCISLQFYSYY